MARRGSDLWRQHISEGQKRSGANQGSNNPMFGDHRFAGASNPMYGKGYLIAGKKHWSYGKPRSLSTRLKISQAMIGKTVGDKNGAKQINARRKMKLAAKLSWQDPIVAKKRQAGFHSPTVCEVKIAALLHDMRLLPKEFKYNELNVKGLIPDFGCEKRKLVILVNGNYWHNNIDPNACKIRHEEATRRYGSEGYKVLTIWESETLNSNFDVDETTKKIQEFVEVGK